MAYSRKHWRFSPKSGSDLAIFIYVNGLSVSPESQWDYSYQLILLLHISMVHLVVFLLGLDEEIKF